eukprot:505526-Prorocentrum_minimum.AAC.2
MGIASAARGDAGEAEDPGAELDAPTLARLGAKRKMRFLLPPLLDFVLGELLPVGVGLSPHAPHVHENLLLLFTQMWRYLQVRLVYYKLMQLRQYII